MDVLKTACTAGKERSQQRARSKQQIRGIGK